MLTPRDLHPYQQRTIQALYESDEMLALVPMGGGKTISVLTAFAELKRDGHARCMIVVAPLMVARNTWADEHLRWAHTAGLRVSLVLGDAKARARALAADADVYVTNFDNLVWLLEELDGRADDDPILDILAIDEITKLKAPRGQRSRALSLRSARFRMLWALTGTPRLNNEEAFYRIVRIVTSNQVWGHIPFEEWRMKYFMPDNTFAVDRTTWSVRPEWKDYIWSTIAEIACIVEQDELPPQPEIHPVEHWVDLPTDARAEYNMMLKEHVFLNDDGGTVLADNAGVASGKLEQMAQGFVYDEGEVFARVHTAKTDKLIELVDLLDGMPAIVVYWFKEDLAEIKRAFPGTPHLGRGTTTAEAQRLIDRWNANELPLLALHPASAGHGLNLQRGSATQIIHYAPIWSAEIFEQVVRRVARQGNTAARVMNHMILARNTVDCLKIARVAGHVEEQERFLSFVRKVRTEGGEA